MKIGIYSGSFNPVHLGHIALADFLVQERVVEEVWLIRSPQNPLKQSSGLMSNLARQEMLELAIEGHAGLKICNIEDRLPLPNYTVRTLDALKTEYPQHEFHLIIGADNWQIFTRWREWEKILNDYHLIVYPRPGYPWDVTSAKQYPTVRMVEAPQYDISSTQIRERLTQGLSLSGWVDPNVEKYLYHDSTQNRKRRI